MTQAPPFIGRVENASGSDIISMRTSGITKSFGNTRVLEELSIRVGRGEFVSLLGPSGCGKTTTLNIVSGFLSPDSGQVFINDRDVTSIPAHKRDSSVVFQNYALFPHLTVEKNIRYGLKARRVASEEMHERVSWALRITAIENLRNRYPGQLSGGQQQRVAVARSLVMRPEILLMDEPLSNLDAKLRGELRLELKALQRSLGQSVLFVTHDQVEALSLSDRVVVMNAGRVEQVDDPISVYEKPRTVFVARFMGVENVYELTEDTGRFRTTAGMSVGDDVLAPGTHAVGIRPNAISIGDVQPGRARDWEAQGLVRSMTYLGDAVRYEVSVGHETVVALSPHTSKRFEPGDEVYLQAAPGSLIPLAE